MKLFKQLFNWWWALKKRVHPYIRTGLTLIFIGVSILPSAINLIFTIALPKKWPIEKISTALNDPSPIMYVPAIVLICFGIWLIIRGVQVKDAGLREYCAIYIRGLPGQKDNFPVDSLDIAHKKSTREAIRFDIITTSLKEIENTLQSDRRQIQQHTYHHGCADVYIAGLARIPVLVAYGSMFRNANAHLIFLDHIHKSRTWKVMDDLPTEVELISTFDSESISPSEREEIGIALAFTTPIYAIDLPVDLKDHTLIYSLNTGYHHNSFVNQQEMIDVINHIISVITRLSKCCKRIHLFLAVQAPVAIELGLRYQDGIHRDWVIHNFDGASGSYNWHLTLGKGSFSIRETVQHSKKEYSLPN